MAAGVFGYLGYDIVRLIEDLPEANPDVLDLPDGLLLRPTIMAIFDSVKDEVIVATPVRPAKDIDATAAYDQAIQRLDATSADFAKDLPRSVEFSADLLSLPEAISNTTRADYHRMVNRAKEYIAAGDIFQVVPSQRFEVPFHLPAFSLYRSLRRLNPSRLLKMGIAASPAFSRLVIATPSIFLEP